MVQILSIAHLKCYFHILISYLQNIALSCLDSPHLKLFTKKGPAMESTLPDDPQHHEGLRLHCEIHEANSVFIPMGAEFPLEKRVAFLFK